VDGIYPSVLASHGFSDDQPMMVFNIKGIKRKKASGKQSLRSPSFQRY
jgi:hypothetical protein